MSLYPLSPYLGLATLSVLFAATLPYCVGASVGTANVDDLFQPVQGTQEYLSTEDYQARVKQHKPWTHPPNCSHSTSPDSLGKKYCVHTNDHAFHTGVSIIATPKRAASVAKHLNEDLASYFFLTEEKLEEWHTKPRPYQIVDIAGKDKGVVASRKSK